MRHRSGASRQGKVRREVLAPLYDPVCVTAFFEEVGPNDYAVNRAINAKLTAFTWDDMATLLKLAQVPRASRLLQRARATVEAARLEWPHLLDIAPASMRAEIRRRLEGGVALTRE